MSSREKQKTRNLTVVCPLLFRLANYGSSDARRIARRASQDIEEILGYIDEPEIIHRDNMILS
jgi:glutamate 5-kinase